ncbi:flagellar hook-basal body complex protein FliE [Quadrisphaera granulorum]|uniref:Flagellar hook-basal body complex protein FliE n=1 Tax=Quadrisphaera granulorum TaxID=317664 RepID=A0A316A3P4_9ACTN|nr:flagellar hook-basal body complex protein FliE [Quadrisphaera granulorum]PWJ52596.1 flagellar hook-basal body complex protein FliE [Quadrisphaera granulorum]SZE97646.1 flagellar hook-basal body complex protein FliE [Quadrisphaera granulorum]
MSLPPIEGLTSLLSTMPGVSSLGPTAGTGASAGAAAVTAALAGGQPTATTATTGTGTGVGAVGATGSSFAQTLTSSLENVQRLQANASDLAVQAATGDLNDVHDYMIAAAKSSMATEVTVAIRNKALEAFNDIMRMQV